jgi:peptide/nickel transport system ATP-binding protein
MALLEMRAVSIEYLTQQGPLQAVNDVSFSLEHNDTLGLVGESGCGKTTLTRAILQLLPKNGRVIQGGILLNGKDLIRMSPAEIRSVRGKQIAMISQSAMNSLDPVYRIGDQLIRAMKIHGGRSNSVMEARVEEMFTLVELSPDRLRDYPHQFSGGMKQRAMIAMALTLNPQLIIADEPTTALDVIVQDRILTKIGELQRQFNIAMILVTHDISVVAETCNKMVVMYAGETMERGELRRIFANPGHPYTLGLLNAFPTLDSDRELISIPGVPPQMIDPAPGCCFAERCPFKQHICQERKPPEIEMEEGHYIRCHFPERAKTFRELARKESTWRQES